MNTSWNPWDLPPLPTRGDDSETETYTGIGRVTSTWEMLEMQLSRLYTVFAGQPDEKEPMDAYGSGNIFRIRLEKLEAIAERWFIAHPSQDGEGLFDKVLGHVVSFSDRRNEIAHSIVLNVSPVSVFRSHFEPDALGKPQFAAIPPLHSVRFHIEGRSHKPRFAYTAPSLKAVSDGALAMCLGVEVFTAGILVRSR